MAVNIHAEALRRKNLGDLRPLPDIVRELSMVAPTEPGMMTVNPSPSQPIPVGQPVDVKPSVPPMTTPYSPVEQARSVTPAPAAAMSATDAALQTALASKDPMAISDAQAAAEEARARQAIQERFAAARARAQVDPAQEEYFKRIEERSAQREASLMREEKRSAWEALAMAGFKMAQSSSPYFAAALAEGMQAGLQGYNAAKAARAEQRARLEDARDTVGLERLKAVRSAEDREVATENAIDASTAQMLSRRAELMKMRMESAMFPEKMRQIDAQIRQIDANIANDNARVDLQRQALAMRGRGGGGGGGDDDGEGGFKQPKYEVKSETDEDGVERTVLVPKGPGGISLAEGPGGVFMPKRYAYNQGAYQDALRVVNSIGASGYEFDANGDMWAVRGKERFRIVHRPKRQ